jgi:hypothetical protein
VLFQVALDLSSTLMVLLLRDLTMWADHYNGGGPFGVKLCLPSIAGLAVSSYNGVDAQYREAERREAPDASSALDRISRRIGVGKAGSGGRFTRFPLPLGTLHRHPEGKKSRPRPFSLAPISEPNGRAKNGLEPSTSGMRGLNKGLQSSSPGR